MLFYHPELLILFYQKIAIQLSNKKIRFLKNNIGNNKQPLSLDCLCLMEFYDVDVEVRLVLPLNFD